MQTLCVWLWWSFYLSASTKESSHNWKKYHVEVSSSPGACSPQVCLQFQECRAASSQRFVVTIIETFVIVELDTLFIQRQTIMGRRKAELFNEMSSVYGFGKKETPLVLEVFITICTKLFCFKRNLILMYICDSSLQYVFSIFCHL